MITRREATYMINRMDSIGPETFQNLVAWYGSPEAAWEERTVPLQEKQAAEWAFAHRPERQDDLRRELSELSGKGIRFLTREDADFPEPLLRIADPPVGLYLKGRLPEEGLKTVGMVGARKCTEYGRETALSFGEQLASCGIGVISGMAMGIDSWSQRGAVRGGGYSLAVLGTGIDICYPPSNLRLYEQLAAQGGILSEYGPGAPGLPFHFPLRNRLISGMSQVLLVLEAREKSGSLITVDYALEQGKEVLALPGRIGDPLSQGCNQLIRQGAGILTGMSDILMALGLAEQEAEEQERTAADPLKGLPEKGRRVYERIGSEPVHQDELTEKEKIPLTELFGILWDLEQRGLIRDCSHGCYIRTSR